MRRRLRVTKKTVGDLASRGYRALGVARSDDGKTWQLLGLMSLNDPPRPDAKATIAQTQELGLNVKMVTGDDVAIGDQIAKQLGMGDHLLVASDVFKEGATTDPISPDVAVAVERADGFGRVFPQHKYEIVKCLQQRGHIVAMTGDGVNDAPALRQADCGIAVSGATDAARSAAALILTAPGLSTIVNAIVGARQIFQRIQSYVYYRVAMTLDIMLLVVASIVFFEFQPLTAVMIVVLALLDDIPIMTIAYDNVPTSPKPERWDMHRILVFSCLMGVLSLAQSLGLLLIGLEWLSDPAYQERIVLDRASLQTMVFLQLAVGGHLLLFVVRTRHSVFSPPYPSAPLFLAIVGTQIIAALICGFGILVPKLPWAAIVGVWVYSLVWMVVIDMAKLLYYRAATDAEARCASALDWPFQLTSRFCQRAPFRSAGGCDEFQEELCVKPGRKLRLTDVDPDFHGQHMSEDDAKRRARPCQGQADGHAASVLRRPQSRPADRTARHRRRGQGRHLLARDQRHGSPGCEGAGLQAADTRRASARLPVAGASARSGQGRGRGLQSLPLRGHSRRARTQTSAEVRLAGAIRLHKPVGETTS